MIPERLLLQKDLEYRKKISQSVANFPDFIFRKSRINDHRNQAKLFFIMQI
jgi:hypothetical protein